MKKLWISAVQNDNNGNHSLIYVHQFPRQNQGNPTLYAVFVQELERIPSQFEYFSMFFNNDKFETGTKISSLAQFNSLLEGKKIATLKDSFDLSHNLPEPIHLSNISLSK